MISYDTQYMENTDHVCYIYGLSTDVKPTEVGPNSIFIELDTKKLYFYQAASETWAEYAHHLCLLHLDLWLTDHLWKKCLKKK